MRLRCSNPSSPGLSRVDPYDAHCRVDRSPHRSRSRQADRVPIDGCFDSIELVTDDSHSEHLGESSRSRINSPRRTRDSSTEHRDLGTSRRSFGVRGSYRGGNEGVRGRAIDTRRPPEPSCASRAVSAEVGAVAGPVPKGYRSEQEHQGTISCSVTHRRPRSGRLPHGCRTRTTLAKKVERTRPRSRNQPPASTKTSTPRPDCPRASSIPTGIGPPISVHVTTNRAERARDSANVTRPCTDPACRGSAIPSVTIAIAEPRPSQARLRLIGRP